VELRRGRQSSNGHCDRTMLGSTVVRWANSIAYPGKLLQHRSGIGVNAGWTRREPLGRPR
jgi:hypothetical protein